MTRSSSPPPLPSNLSSRLVATIDKSTGKCKYHPAVTLCELVPRVDGGGSRWLPRRKTCPKCGSRPGAVGGKHHKPGVSVSHKPSSGGDSKRLGRSSKSLASGAVDSRRASRRASSCTREMSAIVHEANVLVSSNHRVARRSSNLANEVGVVDNNVVAAEKSSPKHSSSKKEHQQSSSCRDIVPVKKESRKEEELTETPPTTSTEEEIEEDNFSDSDPIIMIPFTIDPSAPLPPPPPRSPEEMGQHQERLELRKTHLREQEHANKQQHGKQHQRSKSHGREPTPKKDDDNNNNGDNENGKLKGDDVKVRSKRWDRHRNMSPDAKNESATPVNTPSPAALALLQCHDEMAEKSSPKAGRKSTDCHALAIVSDGNDAGDDDDVHSETSSISSSSAKMYKMQEPSERNLLEGVVREVAPFPPVDVTVDRSVSRSRSRPRRRDPDEGNNHHALVPYDPPEDPPMASSSPVTAHGKKHESSKHRRTATTVSKAVVKTEDKKHHRRSKTTTEIVPAAATEKQHRRVRHTTAGTSTTKPKSTTKSLCGPTSSSKKGEDTLANQLAASSARSRRARSRSKSVGRRENGNISSRQARSVSRARSKREHRHHDDKVSVACDFSKASRSRGGRSRRARSVGGRSRRTAVTQPESLSSDEVLRKLTEDEEQEAEPVVIYKKRAHRTREVDDTVSEYHSKPMGVVAVSSDERSHASSISSSSTIEESFADSDEDDEDDFKSRKSGRGDDVKDKALLMFDGVKGGAKSFATRGKSAFGGLKGTSRKWQSALFM